MPTAQDKALWTLCKRSRHLLQSGHTEVVDADLSGYFDSIPHAELMKSVARRISDGRLLGLIKAWLETPVEEHDERGRKQRTTRNKDEGRGTPQGAPLSPLLANLYMRRFVLGWKSQGHERRLDAHIVNYADDFVICCRGTAVRGHDRHAGHDGEAEADGQRDENAVVSCAGQARLTFWATPSAVITRRGRDAPILGCDRRPRRSKRSA